MYIAVDIGGTKTLVAAFSEDGKILASEKNPTDHDYRKFLHQLIETIRRVAGGEYFESICVAAPGRIDYENGLIQNFGNLDWRNISVKETLEKEFETPVYLDNDANLGGVGEANLGAGVGYRCVLYVTISTGVGTGITFDGKVPPELAKSEGGMMHFRHNGELMIWEKFASGKAFYERFGKMGKDVTDPKIWAEYAEDISLGLGSLVAIIEPDIIVIGGSMGVHLEKYRSFLLKNLQDTRAAVVRIPQIVQAKDPENAVINGCYVICKQHSQD